MAGVLDAPGRLGNCWENLGIGASGLAWRCLASEEPVPGRPRLCGNPGGGLASFQLGPLPRQSSDRRTRKPMKRRKPRIPGRVQDSPDAPERPSGAQLTSKKTQQNPKRVGVTPNSSSRCYADRCLCHGQYRLELKMIVSSGLNYRSHTVMKLTEIVD